MPTFYFVGGPLPGHSDEFFRRLAQAGGPPPTWQIYPHMSGDGKALHVVRTEAQDAITAHLAQFTDIYEASAPTEVVEAAATSPR
jgi:hypothetical protein